MRRDNTLRSGFTLIELLVVMGIMLLMAGMVVSAVEYAKMSATTSASKAQIKNLCAALEAYRTAEGMYVNDMGAYGNTHLYMALSGDVDCNGSVVDNAGHQYFDFKKSDIKPGGPCGALVIIDGFGYMIGYDRTWDPINQQDDLNEQLFLKPPETDLSLAPVATLDPRTNKDRATKWPSPRPMNPRSYDIFGRGPNGRFDTLGVAGNDDITNW